MFKRIHFIALVSGKQDEFPRYTAYFFEKEEKVVLPVTLSKAEVRHLLATGQKYLTRRQNIYEAVARIVLGLGAKVISISVYRFQDGEFYTYLNIIKEDEKLEISIKFSDGVKIAKNSDVPIYIRRDVLLEQGIKVNKEILRDALRND